MEANIEMIHDVEGNVRVIPELKHFDAEDDHIEMSCDVEVNVREKPE